MHKGELQYFIILHRYHNVVIVQGVVDHHALLHHPHTSPILIALQVCARCKRDGRIIIYFHVVSESQVAAEDPIRVDIVYYVRNLRIVEHNKAQLIVGKTCKVVMSVADQIYHLYKLLPCDVFEGSKY